MSRQTSFLILVVLFLIFQSAIAQNNAGKSWNQFRGNNRNGAVSNVELNKWPASVPEKVWKTSIGESFTELLVSGDKVLTMTSTYSADSTSGTEYMIAFNNQTGEEIWKTKVDSLFIDVDNFGDGSRSTPALDNEAAYCLSSFGKLHALSIKNGNILWTVDFIKEFGSTPPRWAFASSPILINNKVIIETGGTENRGFSAFDKNTGKTIWSTGFAKPYYNSPAIAEIDGKTNIIFASDSMLISLDENGEEIWTFRIPFRYPMAMPLFIAPNKVFISAVSQTGCVLVEINNNVATEIYKNNSMKNNWSSSVYHDGYIYGFSNATLKCVKADDGTSKWSKRALGKGSLILVGDKLLVLSDKGVLKLVETNPEAYTELNSFQALEGKSWTAPSYANGRIYLRNLTEMASYKIN
ncbi:MAG: PQQ-binding-like beta-propeller repeat protein [Salinivirgaceae bacterium]|nr:PQQ-binding-like beta-propeller repeat protein [Salinivirgaceae bacterium]